jgi:peptide/nickel transport system permease protein
MNTIANIIISFPTLILLLAIVAVFNHSLIVITLSISFISIPLLFRVIRSATISVANKEFVQAARTMGSSRIRIVFVEILPNITPIIVVYGCLGIGSAIIAEGTLAFLGLSVSLPTPSWGNMIAEGAQSFLRRDFLLTLWPSIMIIMTVVCFNFISQRLEGKFNSGDGAI